MMDYVEPFEARPEAQPKAPTRLEKFQGRHKALGPFVEAVGNMVGNAAELIPAGRILTGVYAVDADATQLQVQIFIAAAWEPITYGDGAVWAGVANLIVTVPRLVGDGATLRIQNLGANQCDAVYYTYEV